MIIVMKNHKFSTEISGYLSGEISYRLDTLPATDPKASQSSEGNMYIIRPTTS